MLKFLEIYNNDMTTAKTAFFTAKPYL